MIPTSTGQFSIKRVLLISNDQSLDVQSLKLWFAENGYELDTATEAMAGIIRAKRNHYVFILIDVDLDAKLNGFEVVWILKTILDEIDIVLIGETFNEKILKKASSYGILHWLQKPICSYSFMNIFEELKQGNISTQERSKEKPVWENIVQIIRKFIHGNKPSNGKNPIHNSRIHHV